MMIEMQKIYQKSMSNLNDSGVDGQEEQKLQYTIAPETRRKWETKKQQCHTQFQRDLDEVLSSNNIRPLIKQFLRGFKSRQE